MPALSVLLVLLLASSEIRMTLLESFLWNMIKGIIYVIIAVILWLLLRRLNRIKPLRRRSSRR
ncbi:MAG: hypothetical protein ACP5PX_04155 [Candidatus Hadarchaeum sp.]|uniref:hypothetical protein n=1 Tax=Candidatus Hadarchaeum sp. TaxID=2883567 RepID=UPI003D127BD7